MRIGIMKTYRYPSAGHCGGCCKKGMWFFRMNSYAIVTEAIVIIDVFQYYPE